MSSKWLTGRLSEARKQSPVWVALFEAVEEWADLGVYPEIERLKLARKTFSDDARSLNHLIGEMGDFFEAEDIKPDQRELQRHIDILWRRQEMHEKRLLGAFESYLNRVMKMHGMTLSWEPLYWDKDEDYSGATYYPKIGPLAQHCDYLSSRGSIYADITYISAESADWLINKLIFAMNRARKILPEHIVVESAIIHRRKDTVALGFSASLSKPAMLSYATNKGDINVSHATGSDTLVTGMVTANAGTAVFAHNKGDINVAHANGESQPINHHSVDNKTIQIAHASGRASRI